MKRLFLALVCGGSLYAAPAKRCPQIIPSVKFPDGIPYCPQEVQTESAWSVMDCALHQPKSWHPATEPEKVEMRNLLRELRDNKPAQIMARSAAQKLQVCRSQSQEKDGKRDSFLVIYTKP